MATNEQTKTPEQIYAEKTSGPNGVLIYTVANSVDEKGAPFFDPTSSAEAKVYYLVSETNRTGPSIFTPPGGTQDIMAELGDKKIVVDPTKEDKLKDALIKLGVTDVTGKAKDLSIRLIKTLQEKGYQNVRLESSLNAAVRETGEETSRKTVETDKNSPYTADVRLLNNPAAITHFSVPLAAKRDLQNGEEERGKSATSPLQDSKGKKYDRLFTPDEISDWQKLESVTGRVRANIKSGKSELYPVYVPDVRKVELKGDRPDELKKEEKVKELMGWKNDDGSDRKYYEKGRWATLADMEAKLVEGIDEVRAIVKAETAKLPEDAVENGKIMMARQDLVAGMARVQAMHALEAQLVPELQAHGASVQSSAKDSYVQAYAGLKPAAIADSALSDAGLDGKMVSLNTALASAKVVPARGTAEEAASPPVKQAGVGQ